MRTPAGFECRYFYGNYFRGRKDEECRLVSDDPAKGQWTPDVCRTCPVPGIIRANACPNMVINGNVERILLGLRKRMKVTVYCTKSRSNVKEPEIGCGQCHPLPDAFEEKLP